MPLLAQCSLRFQIYFLVLWGKCQALNEFIPKNHIFVCFYPSVSSENINRFQTPLIPWKIAQGKAITEALKEAKHNSSVPKPPPLCLSQGSSCPKRQFYTWEGSSNHCFNIPKLPLGDLQTPLYIWQHTLIFFFQCSLDLDTAEYLKLHVLVMPVYKDGLLSMYVDLGGGVLRLGELEK